MPPKIQPKLDEVQDQNSQNNTTYPPSHQLKYQSLGSLLNPQKNNQSSDPIHQIWQDKLRISRFKVSSLLKTLSLREKIKKENIYNINEDICKLHTIQFAMANDSSVGEYTGNMQNFGLEKAVGNLEREIRSEITGCWKDISMMRKDLIEATSDYLSLKRKMRLLGLKNKTNYNG